MNSHHSCLMFAAHAGQPPAAALPKAASASHGSRTSERPAASREGDGTPTDQHEIKRQVHVLEVVAARVLLELRTGRWLREVHHLHSSRQTCEADHSFDLTAAAAGSFSSRTEIYALPQVRLSIRCASRTSPRKVLQHNSRARASCSMVSRDTGSRARMSGNSALSSTGFPQ